jgi:signal transduction histidine kinase
MPFRLAVKKKAWNVLDKYGLVLAGMFIFAYYLWTALDMFASPHSRRSFGGYFLQFDSLILLWLLLVAGFKLQQYKRKQKEEEDNHRRIALEYELQKMQLNLLDDVTTLLTDAINNPLAVISLSAGSIRERFASDDEILGFLDRIEGALKRMREVLADFHKYETKKIMNPAPKYASQNGGEQGLQYQKDNGVQGR